MGFVRVYPVLLALFWFVGCGPTIQSIDVGQTPVMGDVDASHVLVVFSDFECPFCKHAAFTLKHFSDQNPKSAAIYFKHFPLRQHRMAHQAALAAEAARRQGKFWEMHDIIFEHADQLERDEFKQFAMDIGLDVDKFVKDIEHPEVAARIAADRQEGEDLGLLGTPFFVLDGKPFDGRMSELLARLKSEPREPDKPK